MILRPVVCPACNHTVAVSHDEQPRCCCQEPDPRFDEFDATGRLLIRRNRRGQRVYQARASFRFEASGPQRAGMWGDTAIDTYRDPSSYDSPVGNTRYPT